MSRVTIAGGKTTAVRSHPLTNAFLLFQWLLLCSGVLVCETPQRDRGLSTKLLPSAEMQARLANKSRGQ